MTKKTQIAHMSDSTFIERLRRTIDQTPGLTAAGLAKKAGLDNSAIRSLLSGKAKNPRWDTIEKICAALNTTVEIFMADPQTEEERNILRLISQLPVDLRRQLIGYGQALLDAQDDGPQPPDEAEQ